jgi:hypothetical protein
LLHSRLTCVTVSREEKVAFRDTNPQFAAVRSRNAMLRCAKAGECLTMINAGFARNAANPKPRRTAT